MVLLHNQLGRRVIEMAREVLSLKKFLEVERHAYEVELDIMADRIVTELRIFVYPTRMDVSMGDTILMHLVQSLTQN
jgi:hypothetical protein